MWIYHLWSISFCSDDFCIILFSVNPFYSLSAPPSPSPSALPSPSPSNPPSGVIQSPGTVFFWFANRHIICRWMMIVLEIKVAQSCICTLSICGQWSKLLQPMSCVQRPVELNSSWVQCCLEYTGAGAVTGIPAFVSWSPEPPISRHYFFQGEISQKF